MCFAKATLFYGLWVTTASLNFAAEAHQATRGPVLAIDLIIARRRAGELEVEGQGEGTTARELPEEVWEMVKQELLSVEIRQAEKNTLDKLRCGECADNYSTRWGDSLVDGEERGPPVEPAWSHWETPDCIQCMYNVSDSATTFSRTTVQSKNVSALLHEYGLQLASPHMWTQEDDDCPCDFDSLSAIALPRAQMSRHSLSPPLHRSAATLMVAVAIRSPSIVIGSLTPSILTRGSAASSKTTTSAWA